VVTPTNAIQEELTAFIRAIELGEAPPVGVEDGVRALDLAYQIMAQIQR
jgi:predicted dehydrogenase